MLTASVNLYIGHTWYPHSIGWALTGAISVDVLVALTLWPQMTWSCSFTHSFSRCRRSVIARYFGETWDKTQCNKMCDHCNSQGKFKSKFQSHILYLVHKGSESVSDICIYSICRVHVELLYFFWPCGCSFNTSCCDFLHHNCDTGKM